MPVIDYIKDQADRYDSKNMQYEQDILWRIRRAHDKLNSSVLSKARTCRNLVCMQQIMNEIQIVYISFDSSIINMFRSVLPEYMKMAYNNVGDLIELGKEVYGDLSEGIQEQRKIVYTEDVLDIIKDNAFKLIKGKSNAQIEQMRSELTNMVLSGEATRQNVKDMIQSVLDSDTYYAELVAQTELSAIYNMGTIKRMREYQKVSGHRMKKYWHGFKYSENTCEYCRPRIGGIYDLDDESETLPAHPLCRCIWLPIDQDWEDEVPVDNKPDKIGELYSEELIYGRINMRLNIRYGQYMSKEAATNYLTGDRTTKTMDELRRARKSYISDTVDAFGIDKDISNVPMSQEFNQQMDFWKKYVASNIADNNQQALYSSITAINGIMALPWNADQLDKWNQLLAKIKEQ